MGTIGVSLTSELFGDIIESNSILGERLYPEDKSLEEGKASTLQPDMGNAIVGKNVCTVRIAFGNLFYFAR